MDLQKESKELAQKLGDLGEEMELLAQKFEFDGADSLYQIEKAYRVVRKMEKLIDSLRD